LSDLGFVGLGAIGGAIAERLLIQKHSLRVYDINADALSRLVELGASNGQGCMEISAGCEIVFLSLPSPEVVEHVVLGQSGLLSQSKKLRYIVDLSTNPPQLSRKISAAAEQVGVNYLDAPVSGGRAGAKKGALSVMIGGSASAFEAIKPIVLGLGENIFHVGPSGSGSLAKLVNNQIFLSTSVIVQEAFMMGLKAGMQPQALLNVIKTSSAASMVKLAPLFLSSDVDRNIFSLEIAEKDLNLAISASEETGVSMPVTNAAHAVYKKSLNTETSKLDFCVTLRDLADSCDAVFPKFKA
jgi:2-hydroxymethylglutarate dehydrogenase|tara:strand:- start:4082 stop:4975 length:894 start_codon:yes stop_codon:yes gene_type:complete